MSNFNGMGYGCTAPPKYAWTHVTKSVKHFERSNRLDTALYKNYLYLFTGYRILGYFPVGENVTAVVSVTCHPTSLVAKHSATAMSRGGRVCGNMAHHDFLLTCCHSVSDILSLFT